MTFPGAIQNSKSFMNSGPYCRQDRVISKMLEYMFREAQEVIGWIWKRHQARPLLWFGQVTRAQQKFHFFFFFKVGVLSQWSFIYISSSKESFECLSKIRHLLSQAEIQPLENPHHWWYHFGKRKSWS